MHTVTHNFYPEVASSLNRARFPRAHFMLLQARVCCCCGEGFHYLHFAIFVARVCCCFTFQYLPLCYSYRPEFAVLVVAGFTTSSFMLLKAKVCCCGGGQLSLSPTLLFLQTRVCCCVSGRFHYLQFYVVADLSLLLRWWTGFTTSNFMLLQARVCCCSGGQFSLSTTLLFLQTRVCCCGSGRFPYLQFYVVAGQSLFLRWRPDFTTSTLLLLQARVCLLKWQKIFHSPPPLDYVVASQSMLLPL